MKTLLFLLFAGIAAAQNPGVCSRVLNSPAPGQVLSATNTSHTPPCQWTNNGGGGGSVSITATAPIIVTPSPITGTGVVSCRTATGSVSGCLSATDWTTFNGKQAAGNYITALTGDGSASGPGSAAFTLATVNSNVGTFGDATHVAQVTVNAKGLVTAASSVAITAGGTPGGSTTQLQYNNAGAFGGITGATSDGTTVTLAGPNLTTPHVTTILDGNGNPFITSSATASAVDSITIANGVTGNPANVLISATGTDTNINLTVAGKGTHKVFVGSTAFQVTSTGDLISAGSIDIANSSFTVSSFGNMTGASNSFTGNSTGFQIWNGGQYAFSSISGAPGTTDLSICRQAAGVLEVASGTGCNSTGTIRAIYQSSDGTAGATVTTCTGFKNGLCISGT